jgi:hypothetical protein
VICILLLGLILFAVAATVILSLISLYLPIRHVDSVSAVSSGVKQAAVVLPTNTGTKDFGTVKVDRAVDENSHEVYVKILQNVM